ncbi:MAG: acyl-CoA dehydrogenase family protein [Actinomycetota bacterium]
MDLRDSAEEAEFRAGVKAWLEENLPEGWGSPRYQPPTGEEWRTFVRDWSRRLHEAGYAGLTWPKEYGGEGAPPNLQAILLEEMALAEAPGHIGLIGLGMAGPTIMAHGTEEQKKKYLEPMLAGDQVWCQGFSEPGSGSDLASLKTRAVRDGDSFVITGQKVWSSFADFADRCILLTRTGSDTPKHEGITYFLFDMHAPGVEVRPLTQLTGTAEFNEIFLDEVRVPASDVLGEVDNGWDVAITTLMFERIGLGFLLMGSMQALFRRLVQLAKETPRNGSRAADDPIIRDRIAQVWADVQSTRFTAYRSLTEFMKKGAPGPEGSIIKVCWAETNQRLTRLAVDILGPAGALDGDARRFPGSGFWQYQQLRSLGNTIEGGTSEILRNIIAERVLGLPKSR